MRLEASGGLVTRGQNIGRNPTKRDVIVVVFWDMHNITFIGKPGGGGALFDGTFSKVAWKMHFIRNHGSKFWRVYLLTEIS